MLTQSTTTNNNRSSHGLKLELNGLAYFIFLATFLIKESISAVNKPNFIHTAKVLHKAVAIAVSSSQRIFFASNDINWTN